MYENILKKTLTGTYKGYLLKEISFTPLTIDKIKDFNYRKLKKIPHKISYFLFKDKIKEIYKSDCFTEIDNYYLVVDKDNVIYHLSY